MSQSKNVNMLEKTKETKQNTKNQQHPEMLGGGKLTPLNAKWRE